ncbi:hypothetical protein, partial [Pseudomonas gingeri]
DGHGIRSLGGFSKTRQVKSIWKITESVEREKPQNLKRGGALRQFCSFHRTTRQLWPSHHFQRSQKVIKK